MNKTFLKSLLVVAVIALGLSIQSCSNPFNPASKFVGKWRVVSQMDVAGGEIPMSDSYRRVEIEFLGDFQSGVIKESTGKTTGLMWEAREGGILVFGQGIERYHYSFSGNRLTLKSTVSSAGMVLERE